MRVVWVLVLSVTSFSLAQAETIVLSPQKLIDLSLSRSNEVEQIRKQRKSQEIELSRVKTGYDYLVSVNPYYSLNKAETLDAFANEKDKRVGYNLTLEKKTNFGSQIKLAYEKVGVNTVFSTYNLSRNIPETQYKDVFTLEWQQSLWNNAFGRVDKLEERKAKEQQKYYDYSQLESVENVVLNSMKLYWDAYIAQQSLEEAMASRKRYNELLKTVLRKKKLGYTAPGELARTKAELEKQEQRVKLSSQQYLYLSTKLKQHLKLDLQKEIQFSLEKEIPELPQLAKREMAELRELKKVEIQKDQASRQQEITDSQSRAEWNLLTRITSTGIETTGEDSFDELAKWTKPTYYVGLNLRFHFGSGNMEAEKRNAMYLAQLAEIQLKITNDQLLLDMDNQENLLKASFLVVQSADKLLEFRNQAMKEIKRAYSQGRVDIQELINAYNAQNLAATEKIQAVGEYHMNLNRMAALRDELVIK
ncbi:MAG: hypothetical protein CL674_01260 [Bdellovibrionaceae bacterium]|nr:hypothetical protein [Pseudobdellovibrionaceae bacterium]